MSEIPQPLDSQPRDSEREVRLRPDKRFVRQSFYPARNRAQAANDTDCTRLNVGFHLSSLRSSDDAPAHDSETTMWTLEFLCRVQLTFIKVHLQVWSAEVSYRMELVT